MIRLALLGAVIASAGCGGGAGNDSVGTPTPANAEREESGRVPAGAMSSDRGHYETVVEMLRGRAPGLEIIQTGPGRIEVRIRGMTQSLQTNAQGLPVNQEPLVVVDGMPSSRPAGEVLMTLNPKDVSSIDILKDVSSTAVYGTRGANGVIIITLIRDS